MLEIFEEVKRQRDEKKESRSITIDLYCKFYFFFQPEIGAVFSFGRERENVAIFSKYLTKKKYKQIK